MGKLPTKYNGVSTVTSFNNSSTIQHVYAMFNHIYMFSSKYFQSSTIKLQVEKKKKNFKKFSKSSSDKLSFKKFQKIFKVQIKLTLNEKISKLFLSSLQCMKTRKKKFKVQSAKCLVVKFRKF